MGFIYLALLRSLKILYARLLHSGLRRLKLQHCRGNVPQCGFLATRYRIDHQDPDFDDRIACATTPAHLTSAERTSLHGIGPADMARSRCWA